SYCGGDPVNCKDPTGDLAVVTNNGMLVIKNENDDTKALTNRRAQAIKDKDRTRRLIMHYGHVSEDEANALLIRLYRREREEYDRVARSLGVDLNSIKAVAQVETRSDPFYPWNVPAHPPFRSGSVPAMLFERHIFHQQTGGQFDQTARDLSNATPGGYSRNRVQPERLNRAKALDSDAAIEATSYGQFQILGRDEQGYPS